MPRLVTLLPDPDSPTMPSVFPRSTVKDSPSTALTSPSSVGKWMTRSLTSTNADGFPATVSTSGDAGCDLPADREMAASLRYR
jgi:hypothetical protein